MKSQASQWGSVKVTICVNIQLKSLLEKSRYGFSREKSLEEVNTGENQRKLPFSCFPLDERSTTKNYGVGRKR